MRFEISLEDIMNDYCINAHFFNGSQCNEANNLCNTLLIYTLNFKFTFSRFFYFQNVPLQNSTHSGSGIQLFR
jgi:hypothetical protein